MIDEPEMTKSAAERFWGRIAEAPGSEFVKPEAGALDWDDFSDSHAGTTCLRSANSKSAMPDAESFYIPTRPSMAFHGNLQFAIKEAKTLIEAGSKLAFFAPTTGEIERLADIFSEYSVPYQIDLAGERAPDYLRERRNRVRARWR